LIAVNLLTTGYSVMAQDRKPGQSGHKAENPASTVDNGVRKPWLKRPLPWIGAVVTAVVTGVAVTLASHYAGNAASGGGHPTATVSVTSSGATAHLEIDEISLTPATGPKDATRLLTPFTIDIKLLNTGSVVAVINHLRLVVQQFAMLPLCNSQGGFGSSGAYTANLPTTASPGQVIDVPISQLVPAGGADRFDVLLRAPLVLGKNVNSIYLYRVHAYLTYNVNTNPADLGEIIIAFPYSPSAGEYYWTHYYAVNPQVVAGVVSSGDLAKYKQCVIANSHALYSILTLPAMRATDMNGIVPQLAF
jgi:hypothetical protein